MWESSEYKRIRKFSHMAAVENAVREDEERDRQDMKNRLEIWDDDESDELFYVDRCDLISPVPLLLIPSSAQNGGGNDNVSFNAN